MPCTRTLAAPMDGEVACTRIPPISFSIMTMSPGVMSIFSSISSRPSTSTRTGSSSSRLPVRVLATTVVSSSTTGCTGSSTITVCSRPAATSTSATLSRNPGFETVIWCRPGATSKMTTPSVAVLRSIPAAVTFTSETGCPSLRTSTRIVPFCCSASGAMPRARRRRVAAAVIRDVQDTAQVAPGGRLRGFRSIGYARRLSLVPPLW